MQSKNDTNQRIWHCLFWLPILANGLVACATTSIGTEYGVASSKSDYMVRYQKPIDQLFVDQRKVAKNIVIVQENVPGIWADLPSYSWKGQFYVEGDLIDVTISGSLGIGDITLGNGTILRYRKLASLTLKAKVPFEDVKLETGPPLAGKYGLLDFRIGLVSYRILMDATTTSPLHKMSNQDDDFGYSRWRTMTEADTGFSLVSEDGREIAHTDHNGISPKHVWVSDTEAMEPKVATLALSLALAVQKTVSMIQYKVDNPSTRFLP